MSTNSVEADERSAGTGGGDGIKMKVCNACEHVGYCSVSCQSEKRAAELREELLFKQPENSDQGDCPICSLPLPINQSKSALRVCCSKIICCGCFYTYAMEHSHEKEEKCPFCRAPYPETVADIDRYLMSRTAASDPVAIREVGQQHYDKQNYSRAFELWTKSIELDDIGSHFRLADLYMNGQGVEKDVKKGMFHLEEAAIGGDPVARYQLGINEVKEGQVERAMKHFIIAANLGHHGAIEELKKGYTAGYVKKEDLAAAFRAHKAAVDETKSPQRDKAEQYFNRMDQMDFMDRNKRLAETKVQIGDLKKRNAEIESQIESIISKMAEYELENATLKAKIEAAKCDLEIVALKAKIERQM